MRLFKLFAPRDPPATTAQPALPPMTLTLTPAPEAHALPIAPADPLDIAVKHLWAEFRRQRPNGTWQGFIAVLRAHNTELTDRLQRNARDLASLPPDSRYRP